VLVDTSVWVDHLRRRNTTLMELLDHAQVWTHPFVIGELACGNLANRRTILTSLAALPRSPIANHDEVLGFVESRALMGKGLGWIDMHLLASAMVARIPFWTVDKRLSAIAKDLGLQFQN
jgi:predicted nucleic acid-binding protein